LLALPGLNRTNPVARFTEVVRFGWTVLLADRLDAIGAECARVDGRVHLVEHRLCPAEVW
jgi:hypothetical protein